MKSSLVFAGCWLAAGVVLAGHPVMLSTHRNSSPTNQTEKIYEVDSDRLAVTPPWEPGTQEPPLSVGDAVRIASAWVSSQVQGSTNQRVNSINLRSSQVAERTVWYYSVSFHPQGSLLDATPGADWFKRPREAIVLFDRSVVEPVLRETASTFDLDHSTYAIASAETVEEAKPLHLARVYTAMRDQVRFKRVLSSESRALLSRNPGEEMLVLAKMRDQLERDPALTSATFRVGTVEELRKELQGVDPKASNLVLRAGVKVVFAESQTTGHDGSRQSGRGPAFVIKEDGFWRLLLPGLPPSAYYDLEAMGLNANGVVKP